MIDGDAILKETLYDIATLIAAYSNPCMFLDLRGLTEEECQDELDALKKLMGEMIG